MGAVGVRRNPAARIEFIITLVLGALAAMPSPAAAQVSNDLWDVSQGATVTAHSGVFFGDIRGMFGHTSIGPEPQNTLFSDGQPPGFTHFVEWQSASPIILSGYHLMAADDSSATAGDRGFTAFRLFAFDGSGFGLIDTFNPTSNPYPGNVVDITRPVGPLTAQRFRAEFDQFGPQFNGSGPRILELDAVAVAVVPEPGSILLAAVLGTLALRRRRAA